jgi:hypothetical protein
MNKALNLTSVKMLLGRHGYEQVSVDASSTPYRG